MMPAFSDFKTGLMQIIEQIDRARSMLQEAHRDRITTPECIELVNCALDEARFAAMDLLEKVELSEDPS